MRRGLGLGMLTGSLGGIAFLGGTLMVLARKGPLSGAVFVLALALALFVVSLASAIVNKKWREDPQKKPRR